MMKKLINTLKAQMSEGLKENVKARSIRHGSGGAVCKRIGGKYC